MNQSIILHRSAWKTIIEEMLKTKNETGGLLLGYHDESGIFIIYATGPGPGSHLSTFCFERDISYCQQILNNLFYLSGGRITYIGEWHKHSNNILEPSSVDNEAMFGIAETESYQNNQPILLLGGENLKIRTYQYCHDQTYKIINILIL